MTATHVRDRWARAVYISMTLSRNMSAHTSRNRFHNFSQVFCFHFINPNNQMDVFFTRYKKKHTFILFPSIFVLFDKSQKWKLLPSHWSPFQPSLHAHIQVSVSDSSRPSPCSQSKPHEASAICWRQGVINIINHVNYVMFNWVCGNYVYLCWV